MPGANQFRAQDFIDAIPGTGGIISEIARRVGCSWHTAKKYIGEYSTVAVAYDDECESIIDTAENTVITAIMTGDLSTAKWYLTMKAKGRGYNNRQEVDVTSGGEPLKAYVGISPDDWDDDE